MAESSGARVVVLAYDGSEHSKYAYNWFVENIHKDGDRVVVVYCSEYKGLATQPIMSADPNLIGRLVDEEREKSLSVAHEVEDMMKTKGIKGKIVALHGDPGEAIVKVSKEEHATIVVTGTRGLGTFRRTVMGSVSDYVLHHCHVPVVVCRHPDFHHHHHHQHE